MLALNLVSFGETRSSRSRTFHLDCTACTACTALTYLPRLCIPNCNKGSGITSIRSCGILHTLHTLYAVNVESNQSISSRSYVTQSPIRHRHLFSSHLLYPQRICSALLCSADVVTNLIPAEGVSDWRRGEGRGGVR